MITLYGNDFSSPSNKVRYVANALDLNYEYKKLNLLAGDNKTAKYLRLHPAGKIPVIVDGDFVLFESNAIVKYLAQKKSSSLYPTDPGRRALVDQWMDFTSIHIGHAMGRVFFNHTFYKVVGIEKDERSLKDGLGFLERFLPVVDRQLSKNEYLAGPELTLADFCLLATLDSTELAGLSLDPYPKLKDWRKKLQAKDFYQKCFRRSYSEMFEDIRNRLSSPPETIAITV